LVRRWSHLERQTGGAGVRGGPGEKQIELDRRMISETIKRTKERLQKVKRQRQTQRRQRERRDAFNISLIGYTNAGKSSLFNALVKARAYAADQLFATLDTTTRQLYLADAGRSASLSDTVGFIRDLPHGLVDAFQATLQEAIDADLLIHVVDAANPEFVEQIAQVQKVLTEIGAEHVPQLLVFNKIDALDSEHQPILMEDTFEIEGVQTPRIFASAKTTSGLDLLRKRISALVSTPVDTEILDGQAPALAGDDD
ncbi:MAG: GTPase HflX, partial [Burkholderiales bacterium PBB4]